MQSRYYDSVVGRFINADSYVSTGQGLTGHNMFAYCGNNPVDRYDPCGEFFLTATIGGIAVWKIGVAVVGLIAALTLVDTAAKETSSSSLSITKSDATPKIETKLKTETTTQTYKKISLKIPFITLLQKRILAQRNQGKY